MEVILGARKLGSLTLLAFACTASLSANAQDNNTPTCRPAPEASVGAPEGLRINGQVLASRLTSVMDTDSKPLNIEFTPAQISEPLRITLADPKDTGYVVQLSKTQWHYWPGFRRRQMLSPGTPPPPQRFGLVDICSGDAHARVQILPTAFMPDLSDRYPNPNSSPLPHRYDTPIRFVQVNSATDAARRLSPSLSLAQFLPKQFNTAEKTVWPQPVLIQLPLLEKLESILAVLAEQEKPVPTLTILSGYRTPRHNRRVGGARYSRHIFGDAVDFIVDSNQDGKMDDLNDDGKVTRADLRWLLNLLANRPVPLTPGGTGAYESHGQAEAFLHVDARGRAFYWQ